MLSRRGLLATAALWPMAGAVAAASASVRVGSLPFGTVSWEAAIIKARGLDTANGFTLDVVKLAGNDAARIAFLGGQVDTIVGDLLWAARLGNEGRAMRFIPYSTTEGSLMVPPGSSIAGLKDLVGKRLGIAGGPLDKNWLLLKAQAKDAAGIDLESQAQIAYGAPPLLALKLEQGELDAALLYWTYCARLEPKGFRRIIGSDDIMRAFGATGSIALIGYLFEGSTVSGKAEAIAGFARASRTAKEMLANDPSAWEVVRPLMSADDEPTFEALKRDFLAGIPRRPIATERGDGERLFGVLSKLGGERLVGAGTTLPPGLYFDGAGNG
ncbi:ABC transporter substrate-binding protein [Methylobacterium sp. SD274]|uniref:ABC transporter substrate-binding protein n=1 Tax=unclassified Methylobacterium TaxID=2615210 RepID=UPI0006F1ECC3|nr:MULTISPECIES: ABC transporter substrate-binding protein [unclassified Methylobacterium]KQO56109.1 ABC transporter substrate-binding protein [Methylobacterium sp. Leaf86]KQO96064.1 ABC transporter substrate-binding protein [Methylobacterium sp. Leaf91]MBO1019542.1 ABC transporter substrate-binding protein [Methylobacterium sp. SD274]